jgi:dienelactone hydrolase
MICEGVRIQIRANRGNQAMSSSRGLLKCRIRNAICFCGILLLIATDQAFAQQTVSIPIPKTQQRIQADLYEPTNHHDVLRGIVLAHGGSFDRASWRKQAQVLVKKGLVVLSISFRGDGRNPDGSPGSFGETPDNATDVLAAVDYLHRRSLKEVYAIGASMGGDAVGEAAARSSSGELNRIVLLGSSGGDFPKKLTGRKLFLVAREDSSDSGPRLPEISQHFAQAPNPKKLVVVDGTAHAQFLFDTNQGPRVMKEILQFVSEP